MKFPCSRGTFSGTGVYSKEASLWPPPRPFACIPERLLHLHSHGGAVQVSEGTSGSLPILGRRCNDAPRVSWWRPSAGVVSVTPTLAACLRHRSLGLTGVLGAACPGRQTRNGRLAEGRLRQEASSLTSS